MDEQIENDALRMQGIKGTFPGPIENQYETLGALFFIGFVLVFDNVRIDFLYEILEVFTSLTCLRLSLCVRCRTWTNKEGIKGTFPGPIENPIRNE